MKRITLDDWSDFDEVLRREIISLGHAGLITARNFSLVGFSVDGSEVNRLSIALSTGTDRDVNSPFWNADGFDYRHDLKSTGKRGDEIIYGFTIDLSYTPYRVMHDYVPEIFDIVETLTEHDGLIIYDSKQLVRVAKNEYWFKSIPIDAAILIFTLCCE